MRYMSRSLCRNCIAVIVILLLAACSKPRVPASYTDSQREPSIFPEYRDVTVPVNIAPLTFTIEEEGDGYVTRMSAGSDEWVYGGKDVCPTKKEWKKTSMKYFCDC